MMGLSGKLSLNVATNTADGKYRLGNKFITFDLF